jgi:tRNA(adenine34) deaminase
MQAFTAAAEYLGFKYLQDCTLYVTLEPCTMCAGAAYWSQIGKVVYGASDLKKGYHLNGNLLHPKTEVTSGIMAEECQEILSQFFSKLRQ